MKTEEIREAFLSFFEEKGHQRVPSAPLVPQNDPTLLFVNAGMVPFKDCFLGSEDRGYNRATSIQKSLRISGKHNDLENVGRTARHHTFFEMLGNFSFGDYFKKEAILFAWEFLTENLKLDKKRLWVTIFDDDDEAEKLWKENTDVLPGRILRCGEKDNFWSMGETGPCGPCSEIHYFLGSEDEEQSEKEFRKDDGTYIEIWNLVFMQFNRDASGKQEPLPKPSVDTGMGLERIASVVQKVRSNYDTDELRQIISFMEELSGHTYFGEDYTEREDLEYRKDVAFRVVADHVRSSVFLITDGVKPGSNGRPYVLRRLIRRALKHGRDLGFEKPFLFQVASRIIKIMKSSYPEIEKNSSSIIQAIKEEEEQFGLTLNTGLDYLEKQKGADGRINGEVAFVLHDTYGFPYDLTANILAESISKDAFQIYRKEMDSGFEQAMKEQKERSREARKSSSSLILEKNVKSHETKFLGYDNLNLESTVLGMYQESGEIEVAKAGDEVAIVCSETPFYAESGGQLSDIGEIKSGSSRLEVIDVQKVSGQTFTHICKVTEGEIQKNSEVQLIVDSTRREQISRAHSATHILHLALREVLGEEVAQAGSRVSAEDFRFDFSYSDNISEKEMEEIQRVVNREILSNSKTEISEMPINEAKALGAMALFGEKYGKVVRVVKIGERSIELCGGTHIGASGEIGRFNLKAISAVGSGVKRIEATAGALALDENLYQSSMLRELSKSLSVPADKIKERVLLLAKKNKEQEEKLKKLLVKENLAKGADLISTAKPLPGGEGKFIAANVGDVSKNALREMADDLRNRLGSSCLALASEAGGKTIFLVAVSSDLSSKYHAGKLIKEIGQITGAKGGGKAEMAQAGGGEPHLVEDGLKKFEEVLSSI